MATPDGWEGLTLGDIVDVISGCGFPRDLQGGSIGSYPFFKVGDMNRAGNERCLVTADNYVDDAVVRRLGGRICPPGTVVFPKVGGALLTNKRRVLAQASLFDNNVMGLVARHIEPQFLLHWMSSVDLASIVQQGAVPSVNGSQIKALEIDLPPFPEQRKIAAILSSVDETIEKTEAVLAQLQVVKKAMMQELLTRGMPGRHTRFKQTEIGEIPEGWEVVAVGAACQKMFVGIAQAATHAYVTNGGVPIVRTTNVKANRIDLEAVLQVSQEFATQMASKALRAGDVLSGRTGYPGVSALVGEELAGAQCFTLLVSRPGPRLLGKFLVHIMNSPIGDRIVQQGQAGGAQQNLNVSVFEASRVALPPLNEQQEIARLIDALYDRERAEEDQVGALQRTKVALSAALLSGELRVTPDEATE